MPISDSWGGGYCSLVPLPGYYEWWVAADCISCEGPGSLTMLHQHDSVGLKT